MTFTATVGNEIAENRANSAPSEIFEAVGELPSSGRFQYRGHNRGLHSAWTILSSRGIQFRVALVKTKLLDGYNFRSMLWASERQNVLEIHDERKSSREFFLNSQQDSGQICRPTMSKKWGGLEHSKRDHIQSSVQFHALYNVALLNVSKQALQTPVPTH
ncbi:hypothetical protein B0H13DRAFT_1851126 [Mycena leptocephala]|nr:hypothetical protein B0H13DRAFT_1851126 [Mycena leptocephala]